MRRLMRLYGLRTKPEISTGHHTNSPPLAYRLYALSLAKPLPATRGLFSYWSRGILLQIHFQGFAMPNDQSFDTRTTNPANRSVQAVGLSVAAVASGGGGGGSGSFVPVIAQDFSAETVGNANAEYLRGEYSSVTAKSGSVSTMLSTNTGQPPATCGGGNSFGGRINLPSIIPVGKTIWLRMYFYLPASFSMGYNFGTSDGAEASTCGKSADGSGYVKWLVFAPDTSTSRSYMLPQSRRRQVDQSADAVMAVLSEADSGLTNNLGYKLPRDEWFSLQLALKVSKDTNDGFLRAWVNETLAAERTGINTIEANDTGIQEYGLGNYWNGTPYTDGVGDRETFYIDEIIVASDADGYGAPTGTDASGNAYIDPLTMVGDL